MDEESRKAGIRRLTESTRRINEAMERRTKKLESGEKPFCSFCGKLNDEVESLLGGGDAYICNECVILAHGIIVEETGE